MEGDFSNTAQKYGGISSGGVSPVSPKFPDISFISSEIGAQGERFSPQLRGTFATAGMVVGGIAIVSWFVIVIGILVATAGVVLSFLGIKSAQARRARIGLILSAIGGFATIAYIIAIYAGLINYNYFTNELWGIPAGGVQILE